MVHSTRRGASGALLILLVSSLALLAALACDDSSRHPEGPPAATPGMFSTLPTTEPPIVGDEAESNIIFGEYARPDGCTYSCSYAFAYPSARDSINRALDDRGLGWTA